MFWRGRKSRSEFGLEISLLCIVALTSNTAFALKAFQTVDMKGKTRADLHAGQVTGPAEQRLSMVISYLAVDADYFKEKGVSPVTTAGFRVVGQLRRHENLL